METYVSPACAGEALGDSGWPGWVSFDWVTVMANVLVSIGLTLSTRNN